jgi:hypothetical protein
VESALPRRHHWDPLEIEQQLRRLDQIRQNPRRKDKERNELEVLRRGAALGVGIGHNIGDVVHRARLQCDGNQRANPQLDRDWPRRPAIIRPKLKCGRDKGGNGVDRPAGELVPSLDRFLLEARSHIDVGEAVPHVAVQERPLPRSRLVFFVLVLIVGVGVGAVVMVVAVVVTGGAIKPKRRVHGNSRPPALPV